MALEVINLTRYVGYYFLPRPLSNSVLAKISEGILAQARFHGYTSEIVLKIVTLCLGFTGVKGACRPEGLKTVCGHL